MPSNQGTDGAYSTAPGTHMGHFNKVSNNALLLYKHEINNPGNKANISQL